MRLTTIGWAIVVLALTFSIWNVLEYRENVASIYAVMDSVNRESGLPERAEPNIWLRQSAKYIEREVLIVGVAVAAWVLFGRAKPSAR